MQSSQIATLILKNKCNELLICDYGGNKLMDIIEKSPSAAAKELEEILPDFSEYRKLEIKGRANNSTPWTKSFCWQLEFDKKDKTIAGLPAHNQTIGAMEYVSMMKEMMTENLKLQSQLLEKTIQANNNDPEKWIPLIQTAAPMLGLHPGGIQGPPTNATEVKKSLHFGDVDTSKMNSEQISEEIGKKLNSISKKISGPQMYNLVTALDNNPMLSMQIDNISILLNAIISKPHLLEGAMKFV